MTSSESSVRLAEVISAITTRQPVLNHDSLTADQLQTHLTGIGSLTQANNHQLSFLSDKAYASVLSETKAAVVLVSEDQANQVPAATIAVIVASPYVAYACATRLFEHSSEQLSERSKTYIHPTAQLADSVELGEHVYIGAYCVIGKQVKIGSGCQLHSHVSIDDRVVIGEGCVFYPYSFIGHDCQLGSKVRVHAGASIGSEGFGFAPMSNTATEGWERIAQLGRVIIGDNVRIGSQTCIDRGAIDDTIIEDNVIIDNLVQIGHNVKVGAGTAIAGKVGIAGSATIGKYCMIGGGVGIAGHLEITDGVVLTGMTLVSKSIKKPGVYSSGVTSMPAMDWRRAMVKLRGMGKK
ncbi:UDP-3-O-(3-hydroxymyristoyl)glucosamine N-acyltransferase [Psychrobacter sp.]|uniref:UDP-3-O-(3-hydroxymyristoyl)glucosamine N-acyltransferase n=1 Tax=Psychrobacter sp. TaxID=56811 RepID=UPI0025E460FB|nr:UDP-3-O-(3-hydroxymyristoyl)glucosamine N-acyltransferase [Psychrobacter sp.]